MMSAVPGGPGVGRPGVGIAGLGMPIGGSGSGGASLAVAPGAGTRGRDVSGGGAGTGVGFGSVMTAAMAAGSHGSLQAEGRPGAAGAGASQPPLQKPSQKLLHNVANGSAESAASRALQDVIAEPATMVGGQPGVKPDAAMTAGAGKETRTATEIETQTDLARGVRGAGSPARAAFALVVEAARGLPMGAEEPASRGAAGPDRQAGCGGVENTGNGIGAGIGAETAVGIGSGTKVLGPQGLDGTVLPMEKADAAVLQALASERTGPAAVGAEVPPEGKATDSGAGRTGNKDGSVTGSEMDSTGSTEGGGRGWVADGVAQGEAGRSTKGKWKKEELSQAGSALPGTLLQAAVEGTKAGVLQAASRAAKTEAGTKAGRSSVQGTGVARVRSLVWAAVVEAARGGRQLGTNAANGERGKAGAAAGLAAFAGSLAGKDAVSGAEAKIVAKQGHEAGHTDGRGAVSASASGSVPVSVPGNGQNTGLAAGEPAGPVHGAVPGLASGPAGALPGSGQTGGRGTASQAGSWTTKGVMATGAKAAVAAGAGGNGSMMGSGFAATLLKGYPGTAAGTSVLPHASGGMGGANPYTRMDEPQRPALVYASPQKMAVAVSDPTLGSFQVRAQGAGAQVAASLATASAVTHAQLSGHLPSLTAFLQDQRVDVSRVTVVQQSLVGGDAGPRDSGGRQQGRSGSRRARPQAGSVGEVGTAGEAGSVRSRESNLSNGSMDLVCPAGMEAATGMDAKTGADRGGFSYVDLHA